ncbi:MAG: hypothetical protein II917_00760 [Synergistaceae bacterium]|nr:hypothetical protein [Synergistaceae bacterium]
MLRKIFITALIIILSCSVINAAVNSESESESEEYDLAGLWHIEGGGFARKNFVKASLELTGDMNLVTKTLRDARDQINRIISDEVAIDIDTIDEGILDSDMKVLTSYDINMKLTVTDFEIRAWKEYLPNGIKIPVLLPEKVPSGEYNLTLPPVTYGKLTYQVTFTSATSGIIIISGYIDVDIVGECEIYSETDIWKDTSTRPGNSNSAKGGCNVGFTCLFLFLLLISSGVIKRVWN